MADSEDGQGGGKSAVAALKGRAKEAVGALLGHGSP
jgi:hypothetical protein